MGEDTERRFSEVARRVDDRMAYQALSRIEAHEAVCAERYGNIKETISTVNTRMGRFEAWLAAGMGTVLLGLITVLYQIFAHKVMNP